MNYIYLQPANTRFKWELEVAITNLLDLGVDNRSIWLVFSKDDDSVPKYLFEKYDVNVFVYNDLREDKGYIPSIRPYLWAQFLRNNPEMQYETFCYLDSDTIFQRIPDWNKLPSSKTQWFGSDCNSYLGKDYIDSKGETLLQDMATQAGHTNTAVNLGYASKTNNVVGATWVISQPTAEFWETAYYNTLDLYNYLTRIESHYINLHKDEDYKPIQKWTAEMWAVLWTAWSRGISTLASNELIFTWSTDPASDWMKHNLLHNAGVVNSDMGLFFKGAYSNTEPYADAENGAFPNTDKASYYYVQAIKRVTERDNYMKGEK